MTGDPKAKAKAKARDKSEAKPDPDPRRITRDDLREAYTRTIGEGQSTARAAVPQAAVLAGAAALVVVTLAYLAGRRRGRKRSAVVEIRRL